MSPEFYIIIITLPNTLSSSYEDKLNRSHMYCLYVIVE